MQGNPPWNWLTNRKCPWRLQRQHVKFQSTGIQDILHQIMFRIKVILSGTYLKPESMWFGDVYKHTVLQRVQHVPQGLTSALWQFWHWTCNYISFTQWLKLCRITNKNQAAHPSFLEVTCTFHYIVLTVVYNNMLSLKHQNLEHLCQRNVKVVNNSILRIQLLLNNNKLVGYHLSNVLSESSSSGDELVQPSISDEEVYCIVYTESVLNRNLVHSGFGVLLARTGMDQHKQIIVYSWRCMLRFTVLLFWWCVGLMLIQHL